jgi:hypothetical protein
MNGSLEDLDCILHIPCCMLSSFFSFFDFPFLLVLTVARAGLKLETCPLMGAREIDFLGVHILERNVNFNFVILVSFRFSYFICWVPHHT